MRIPYLWEEVSRQENLRSPAVQRKKGTDKQEREANQCKVETREITLPRFHSLDPVCLFSFKCILSVEHWFTFFFHSATGSGQQCCFNRFGNLMVGQPDAGSLDRVHPNAGLPVISHFFHDKALWEDCCRNSGNCGSTLRSGLQTTAQDIKHRDPVIVNHLISFMRHVGDTIAHGHGLEWIKCGRSNSHSKTKNIRKGWTRAEKRRWRVTLLCDNAT